MHKTSVLEEVRIVKDKDRLLKIDDFLQKDIYSEIIFRAEKPNLNRHGKEWYILELKNPTKSSISWTLSNPRINTSDIKVYQIENNRIAFIKQEDDLRPPIAYPSFRLESATPAQETSKIIIEADYGSTGFMYGQFDIEPQESYHKNMVEGSIIKSFSFGGIFIIFVYNLFLLFSLRTRIYFWYSVYMFVVILFSINVNGVGHEYIWGTSDYFSRYAFALTYPFVLIAALQFSRHFLQTKERFLKIDRVILFFMTLFLVLVVVLLLGYKEHAPKIFFMSSFVMCLLPFLGLYFWLKGYREVRFYVLAWSGWVVGMIPTMLMLAGFQISYETVSVFGRVGLWFEATILSFALADQINILKAQRDEAEAKYEAQKCIMEIQSRQAQMGEMIAAIGHQWKQPLTIAIMYANAIKDEVDGLKDEISTTIDSHANTIIRISENMNKILIDFKNFFSTSKLSRCFQVIDSIKGILSMIGKQYEHEGIEFIFESSGVIEICGHENEFRQVIINLFNNARDALVTNKIANKRITVNIIDDEKSVMIKIADNGGGIPNSVIDNIFEQYFTTKGEKGTGIGLYLSKLIIIQSFDGTINVKNAESGAEFTIIIPKKDSV